MTASSTPNFDYRMYESRFPEVDTPVMIQVKEIGDVCTHVALLEYNNVEGMILLSDLSRRRIRSVRSLIKVGRIKPAMVLRVNAEKGYIDLSKKRLSEQNQSMFIRFHHFTPISHRHPFFTRDKYQVRLSGFLEVSRSVW